MSTADTPQVASLRAYVERREHADHDTFSMGREFAELLLAEYDRVRGVVPSSAVVMVFKGGPWDGQSHAGRVTAPVFAVGDSIGNHYWLDTKSDPPTYIWDGTSWDTDEQKPGDS